MVTSSQMSGLSIKRLSSFQQPTPFLVMDAAHIRQAYTTLTRAMPGITIHYAMKCNPDERVLQVLRGLGCKFEIASYPELQMLMAIGVPASSVLFSNPVKTPQHIRQAYAAGLRRFAFDSVMELEKIATHAPGSGVYVRLQTAGSSAVLSEGKYGVGFAQALHLLRLAKQMGLETYGIAFHVGSQMENAEAWVDTLAQSAALMRVLQEEGIRLKMLDIGGGFPARYGNFVPSPQTFGAHITAALRRTLPYEVEITMEPGRGLVADAGVMVATVIGVAKRNNKHWVHLDVGAFNGMMEALETQNQLRFPLGDSKNNPRKATYHLTGPTCDSQDTILYNAELSRDISLGDRVYIYTAGAYTTSYSSNFNGFDIPATYVVG